MYTNCTQSERTTHSSDIILVWMVRFSKRHIRAQEVVVLAEGVYDQEVADHAGDADGEDDGADGVVGVVGHVHCGEGVLGLGRHRHLEDKTGKDM